MTTDKSALVILTNEAFLPKGGKGRYQPSDDQWATVHDPKQGGNPTELEATFTRTHRLTGIDALEVGYFWLVLKRHMNIDVTFCSPRGGAVAVDPASFEMAQKDEKLKDHLRTDSEFMEKICHTLPIKWIDPTEYSIVLIPGRHGAMFDLPECDTVEEVIETIYENNGWICAIGHGVSALLNVQTKQGEYLLKNKRITCYTNAEEKEKRFDDFLPFLLEDKVRERGAQIDTTKPFTPHVVVSEHDRLITAQSFPSIKQFMQKITEKTMAGKNKALDIENLRW